MLTPKDCVPVEEMWSRKALQYLGLFWLLRPPSSTLALLQVTDVLEGVLQLIQSMEVL